MGCVQGPTSKEISLVPAGVCQVHHHFWPPLALLFCKECSYKKFPRLPYPSFPCHSFLGLVEDILCHSLWLSPLWVGLNLPGPSHGVIFDNSIGNDTSSHDVIVLSSLPKSIIFSLASHLKSTLHLLSCFNSEVLLFPWVQYAECGDLSFTLLTSLSQWKALQGPIR